MNYLELKRIKKKVFCIFALSHNQLNEAGFI